MPWVTRSLSDPLPPSSASSAKGTPPAGSSPRLLISVPPVHRWSTVSAQLRRPLIMTAYTGESAKGCCSPALVYPHDS